MPEFVLGFGRANLKQLRFVSGVRDVDEKNVARLRLIFKTEGCQREDSAHVIPALIAKAELDQTWLTSNRPAEIPLSPDQTLLCLHGKHRVLAAKEVLPLRDQWWTLALYDDSKFPLR